MEFLDIQMTASNNMQPFPDETLALLMQTLDCIYENFSIDYFFFHIENVLKLTEQSTPSQQGILS